MKMNNTTDIEKGIKITRTGDEITISGNTSSFLQSCLRAGYNFALTLMIMKMMISTTLANPHTTSYCRDNIPIIITPDTFAQLQNASLIPNNTQGPSL